jgi:predicted regulator of Ras-like GTPase activity (Roadblock/LC7/MglB family)
MGMQGNLRDMAIADLIQHNCQDRKTAQLKVENSGREAVLYFEDGNVTHAVLENQTGEEVIYEILHWEDGMFDLEAGIKPDRTTITRAWSGILLEGARRLDENELETEILASEPGIHQEIGKMANLDEILKQMSAEVTGYIACALVGLDGLNIASHTSDMAANPETISAQLTMLLKLAEASVEKLGAGVIEDNLTTTEHAYILMRFLPGKQYYLSMAAHRKTGNLGNMRLISRIYAERLSQAMPQ